jgi:hypothetical protein
MRLGTLSLFASCMLVAALARGQDDSADTPLPPQPSRALPPNEAMSGPRMGPPAWQTTPYGYNYGGFGGGSCQSCQGGCQSVCDSCCSPPTCCRPSLRSRLKKLRCKLSAALSRCRKCSSCCSSCCETPSCCSSCGTGYESDGQTSYQAQPTPATSGQQDLLPVPPPEPAVPYDGDAEDDMDQTSSAPAMKRHSHGPRISPAKTRRVVR